MSRQNSREASSLEVTLNGSQIEIDPIGNGTKPFDDVKVLLVKGADGTGAESLASEFSSSAQYWENQSFCTHDGKLYLCTTRHLAQPWNPADFTEVTVSDAFMAKGRDRVTAGRLAGSTAGNASTAEGQFNTASGTDSHAEGYRTKATKTSSHSEGSYTEANHNDSHAEGNHTVTGCNNQHVQGKYNVGKSDTAFEIGNGTSDNARSNALEVDWDGDAKLSGNFLAGTKEVYAGSQTANSNYGFTNKNDEISVKVDGTVIATISNTEQKDIVTIVNDTARILTYGNSFTQSVGSSQTINIGCFVLDRTSYIVASGDVLDGSGNRLSEKINTEQVWVTDRKEITTSGWSAEPNASGYYSYSLTASKAFMYNKTPTISASGSSATTLPTDAQAKAYEHIIYPNGYVEHYNETIFKLYAKEKPTSNFYILIRGIRKAQ